MVKRGVLFTSSELSSQIREGQQSASRRHQMEETLVHEIKPRKQIDSENTRLSR